MRVHQDGQIGLAEHVNESRRDDHAVRVNGARGLCRAQKADGRDASVAYADVAGVPGRAGAINDVAVANDEVIGGGRCVEGREERRKMRAKREMRRSFGMMVGEIVNGGARGWGLWWRYALANCAP